MGCQKVSKKLLDLGPRTYENFNSWETRPKLTPILASLQLLDDKTRPQIMAQWIGQSLRSPSHSFHGIERNSTIMLSSPADNLPCLFYAFGTGIHTRFIPAL